MSNVVQKTISQAMLVVGGHCQCPKKILVYMGSGASAESPACTVLTQNILGCLSVTGDGTGGMLTQVQASQGKETSEKNLHVWTNLSLHDVGICKVGDFTCIVWKGHLFPRSRKIGISEPVSHSAVFASE